MLAIELRFLANRFHATPWDRQVNEGAVEWPPSPWRVARALVATWHLKGQGEITEADLRDGLRLFEAPPSYRLPPAIVAHTRHYMPIRDKTTKVFDTFVRPADWGSGEGDPDATLVMAWEAPPALSDGGRAALRLLCERLGYLGRAESWVEAALVEGWDGEINARPLDGAMVPDGEVEQLRLLAPEATGRFSSWRTHTVDAHTTRRQAVLRARDLAKGKADSVAKPTPKDRAAIETSLPIDMFAALHAQVGDLRKDGWSQPPGSRWIAYGRSMRALTGGAAAARSARARALPTVARFALVNKPLPLLEEAVRFGDLMRSTAMRKSEDLRGPKEAGFGPAAVFTGRQDDGKSQANHTHAYFLPESCGRGSERGRITHMTVFARQGFDALDRQALMRCEVLYDFFVEGKIKLVFLGFESPDVPGGEPGPCPTLASATTWESVTPFVPPRHCRDGRDDPAEGVLAQVRRELAYHGLPAEALLRAELLDSPAQRARWLRFRRQRLKGGGSQGSRQGYGIRLTFDREVRGPIALGYGAHFGLGRFEPAPGGGTDE